MNTKGQFEEVLQESSEFCDHLDGYLIKKEEKNQKGLGGVLESELRAELHTLGASPTFHVTGEKTGALSYHIRNV
jgi:hypothetical protein